MIFLGNNFKTLDLKSSYETGQDDLIEEFYAPVLNWTLPMHWSFMTSMGIPW